MLKRRARILLPARLTHTSLRTTRIHADDAQAGGFLERQNRLDGLLVEGLLACLRFGRRADSFTIQRHAGWLAQAVSIDEKRAFWALFRRDNVSNRQCYARNKGSACFLVLPIARHLTTCPFCSQAGL